MKKLHTYLFIISLTISGSILSQEKDKEKQDSDVEKKIAARDTLPPAENYGLRLGVDISRLIRTATSDTYTGFEINGDFRVYKKLYVAAELGNEKLIRDEENINVTGSGSYIRFGFDYNSYDNWYGMQNSIYAGLRYGIATFDQTLNSYQVFTGTSLFPPVERTEKIESDGLTAGWIGFVLGLKVETFKNLYLGASVTVRKLMSEKTPKRFDNLFIPGYGKTNDYGDYSVGYNYTISYLIPFKKKRR